MNTINFCPFCGARDLDDTPRRTKCRTCGEEFCLLYPEELEALEADRQKMTDVLGWSEIAQDESAERLAWFDEDRRIQIRDYLEALKTSSPEDKNLNRLITELEALP